MLDAVCGMIQTVFNPFRTAVPFWGQNTWNLTGLSPKQNCGSKRVKKTGNLWPTSRWSQPRRRRHVSGVWRAQIGVGSVSGPGGTLNGSGWDYYRGASTKTSTSLLTPPLYSSSVSVCITGSINKRAHRTFLRVTYANGNTRFPTKVLTPKISLRIFQVQLAMGTFLWTGAFGKARTNNYGVDVGPRSASGKLRRMFGSKRRDSESSTDIDRQNQRLRHELWTGCAR